MKFNSIPCKRAIKQAADDGKMVPKIREIDKDVGEYQKEKQKKQNTV